MREHIGELEELVLLIVAVISGEAYGVSVKDEIKTRTGRTLTISSVHKVLKRLEGKGLVESSFSAALPERGGRKKRLFSITSLGKQVLSEIHHERNSIWNDIPALIWKEG